MEPKSTTLGSSLYLSSLKELAKEQLTTVPRRFVQPQRDPLITSDATPLPQVPVIDMQKLDSQELKNLELEKLHHACKEWGFFQLINHGMSNLLMEKVKKEIQEFFNLPMEEKKKFWQQPGDTEGFGQGIVVEEQKLNWVDMFYIRTLPTHLRKPHLFPMLPLPFRDTLEAYSAELKSLTLKILYLLATILGMEPNYIKELFEDGWQAMRMNYYPPCPQPELVTGLGAHSDCVGLTVLLQINEMEGLQIKKDAKWVPVKPLPNALVINVGDILEIVTNGVYRSIEHRATVNPARERLSIAAFYCPNLDADMGPAPNLITPENPPLFKRIGVEEYYKGYFSRKNEGKAYLDAMRIHNAEGNSN